MKNLEVSYSNFLNDSIHYFPKFEIGERVTAFGFIESVVKGIHIYCGTVKGVTVQYYLSGYGFVSERDLQKSLVTDEVNNK